MQQMDQPAAETYLQVLPEPARSKIRALLASGACAGETTPQSQRKWLSGVAVNLPPTATILARLTAYRTLLEAQAEPPATLRRLARDVEILTAQLVDAEQRDVIAATRPAGCWCLGLGGRHPVALPTLDPPDDPDELPMTWAEFCDCPDGETAKAARAEHWAAYRPQQLARRFARLIGKGGLGDKYEHATLDGYLERVSEMHGTTAITPAHHDVVERIAWWADEDPRRWLYLWGEYGVGKTGLIAAALRRRIEAGKNPDAQLITVPELLERIQATFGVTRDSDGLTTDGVVMIYRTCSLLVLDDWGQHNATAWAQSQLWTLVNARYRTRGVQTAITSNLSDEDFAGTEGAGIGGRILEDAVVVEVPGPSLRG